MSWLAFSPLDRVEQESPHFRRSITIISYLLDHPYCNEIFFDALVSFTSFSQWKVKLQKLRKPLRKQEKFKDFFEHLDKFYKIAQDQTDLERLRGYVFEKLVFEILQKTGLQTFMGCQFIINGEPFEVVEEINVNDEIVKVSKKTMDVAVYEYLLSIESYELKVSPSTFKFEDIHFTNKLIETLEVLRPGQNYRICIGCGSVDISSVLEICLKKKKGFKLHPKIQFLGIDNLYKLPFIV